MELLFPQKIFDEVVNERARQLNLGRTSESDDNNTKADFIKYIEYQEGRAYFGSIDDARSCFIKIAALAVAAIQTLDRKKESINE